MRLATLHKLWMQAHPTGGVYRGRGTGTYNVSFATGQRLYTYRSTSVYALAERLGIIPEYDVIDEAHRVVDNLLEGRPCVVADAAAGDTARALWDGPETIVSEYAGVDQFDRQLARFSLSDVDGWSCTV